MYACACVTAAATEVTVSADFEKMKINEMPIQDVDVNREPRRPDVFQSEPGITKAQEATAEATAATGTAESAPGATISTNITESATALQAPTDAFSPAELEVTTKVTEGDVVKTSEEEFSEDVLDDGTTLKKKVITTKHVQPVTTFRTISGVEEQHTVDKLLGIKIDEHVLVMQPGVAQLSDDQLVRETEVMECEDEVKDGTWLKRKLTTVTVKRKKTPAAQLETEKPMATLSSSVPGSDQFAVDQQDAQLAASAAACVEMPPQETLDLYAPPQPSVGLHHKDVIKASLEQQSPHIPGVDSTCHLEKPRRTQVELDGKAGDDTLSQSKPNIIPVKLTKLEPLSKDRSSIIADTNKPAEAEQKPPRDEPQQLRSGSPSLSVVRLTKLEPLSFERTNGNVATDQPRVESTAMTPDTGQEPEEPQKSYAIQPTTEDMIVPVPSTRQMRGRPTMPEPLDDDLDTIDETPIQVEETVDQFAVAPSNIKPAVEHEITETLATAPGF